MSNLCLAEGFGDATTAIHGWEIRMGQQISVYLALLWLSALTGCQTCPPAARSAAPQAKAAAPATPAVVVVQRPSAAAQQALIRNVSYDVQQPPRLHGPPEKVDWPLTLDTARDLALRRNKTIAVLSHD